MQTKKRLRKIEVIFDRDHGTGNQGWYVRLTDAQGMTYDHQIAVPSACQDIRRLQAAGREEARFNGFTVYGIPVEVRP